jgi:serine/threonine protein kinase
VTAIHHIFNEIHYRILRVIAEGGMGVIYEALQHGPHQFSKQVAIKVIREEFSDIDGFRNNFVGEAKLVADLIHTNIVQIYHLGEMSNQIFMVMEYVNGINLAEFLEKHAELDRLVPVNLCAFIASRVCRGLAYAHKKRDREGNPLNIVHRDVNPRNIMLHFEGDVKLTDFGIAKAFNLMNNEEGEIIAGKDEYLSPEQANYEITDSRSDIFGLGIVLAEMLLGENFFMDQDVSKTRENICNMQIPDFSMIREDIPPKLNRILHRALARNRDDRYSTADEMLIDLELFLYSDGYGPTNEKLAIYVQNLFGVDPSVPSVAPRS